MSTKMGWCLLLAYHFNVLTYEECKQYFDGKKDILSAFRSRQIEQAIIKAKRPPVVNVDEKANTFLKHYISYQKEHWETGWSIGLRSLPIRNT